MEFILGTAAAVLTVIAVMLVGLRSRGVRGSRWLQLLVLLFALVVGAAVFFVVFFVVLLQSFGP